MRKLGQFLSAAHITEFNLAERAQLRPIFNVETLQSNVNKFYSCGSLALTSLRKIYYLLEYFLKESLIAAAGAPPYQSPISKVLLLLFRILPVL